MNKHPISLQPPRWDAKISPFWMRASRRLRKAFDAHLGLDSVEVHGLDRLRELIATGAGVLIAPNHSTHIDANTLYAVADQLGHPFYFMTAWQVFQRAGWRWSWLYQRLGCFSIGREGNDRWAFKRAIGILAEERFPLVIFPEGEIYHLNDRITPLREGVAAMAISAARQEKRPIFIVPTGLRYRYLDDPTPALETSMDALEEWLHWRVRRGNPLAERIVRFAEALLAIKEVEYLGKTGQGALPERVRALREAVMSGLEKELNLKPKDGHIPERIKEARRALLERLDALPEDSADREPIERRLEDVFFVIQLFSYPGDYVAENPAIERLAETIDKFEEDVLGLRTAKIHGKRRASVTFGEPIDVAAFAAKSDDRRKTLGELTLHLEHAIQAMLDAKG